MAAAPDTSARHWLWRGVGRGVRWLWLLAAILTVGLAAVVSVGRYYTENLHQHRDWLRAELRARSGLDIDFVSVAGQWRPLGPVLHVTDLRLYGVDRSIPAIHLPSLEVSLSLFASLLHQKPVFDQLALRDARLRLVEGEDGRWHVPGIPQGQDALDTQQLLSLARQVRGLQLSGATLVLQPRSGEPRALRVLSAQGEGGRDFTRLQAEWLFPGEREPARLRLRSDGEAGSPALRAEAWLALPVTALDSRDWRPDGPRLQLQEGRAQAWLGWQANEGWSGQGELSLGWAALTQGEGAPLLAEDLSARWRGRWREGEATLELHVSPSTLAGASWPALALHAQRTGDGSLTLWANVLPLAPVAATLQAMLPEAHTLRDMLATMAPRGTLAQATLSLPGGALADFRLLGRLEGAGLTPWHHVPGGDGISGVLEATAQGGRVWLDARGFSMAFPDVYREPLHFEQASGVVDWRILPDRVLVGSQPLTLRGELGDVRGLLRLDLPRKQEAGPPRMTLAIGLRNSEARFRDRLIPFTLSESLRGWLAESILPARVLDSGFWFEGALTKGSDPSVQLYFNVRDGGLRFHPDWPALQGVDGMVVVDEQRVRVDTTTARMFDSQLEGVSVTVAPRDRDGLWLAASGGVRGDASDLLRIINQSPLRAHTGDALTAWQASGPVSGTLALDIPLQADDGLPDKARVDVDLTLENATLDIQPLDLPLRQISGAVRYRHPQGLTADALRGVFWGQPLTARLQSGREGLRISAKGRAPARQLLAWGGLPGEAPLAGMAPFAVDLTLGGRQRLVVTSDTRGLSLDLPPPLGKPADEARALQVTLEGRPGAPQQLGVTHGEVRALVALRDLRPVKGNLALGGTPHLPEDNALVLSGRLAEVDLRAWQALLPLLPVKAATGSGPRYAVRDLQVARFSAGPLVLEQLRLDAAREEKRWLLRVANGLLQGRMAIPDDGVMAVDVDRLALPAAEVPAVPPDPTQPPVDALAGLDPAILPAMNVKARNLTRGGQPLGEWSLALRPMPEGVHVSDLRGRVRGVTVAGQTRDSGADLLWRYRQGRHSTTLLGRISTGNVGKVMEDFGYARAMTSKRAQLDVNLGWPASPLGWWARTASGQVGIEVDEGSFVKMTGTAPNALRLFGIFNFDTILRRLRFDFRDLYSSGMAFDQVRGQLRFDAGTVRTAPAIDIAGASSRFRMQGDFDLRNETVNAELLVTVPLASNLPWVVGFTMGPVAAAGAYVAGKLLEKQVDRLSSAAYAVQGPWSDPQVDFVRAFDKPLAELDKDSAREVTDDASSRRRTTR